MDADVAAVEEVAGKESVEVEVVSVCRVSAQIVSRVETGASDADCGFLLQLAMAHTIAMMRMRGFMIIVVILYVLKTKKSNLPLWARCFSCGAYRTRTSDLLRDRQAF